MTKHRKSTYMQKLTRLDFAYGRLLKLIAGPERMFAGHRGMLWRSSMATNFRFCTKRHPCILCSSISERLRRMGRPVCVCET